MPIMRVLLILIIVLCVAIVGLSLASRVAVKAEQIDMRAELEASIATAQPPVEMLLDNHTARIDRFCQHWIWTGGLAAVAALAALVCLGLSLRTKGAVVPEKQVN